MKQYEIWWASMPAPVGRRPVMLLTRPDAYGYLHKVIAVEVSTTIRGIRQEVILGAEEGLKEPSAANFDNVHVVAKRFLDSRIGCLPSHRSGEVKRALGFALGWPELIALG